MFCTKCGAKLEDGAIFCTSCGAKFETETPALEPQETPAMETPVAPVAPAAPVEQVQNVAPQATEPVAPQPVKEKKPINKKIFLFGGIGLGAALLIAAVIIIVVNVVKNSNKQQGFVYYSEGSYYFMNSDKDKKDAEIDDSRNYLFYDIYNWVKYSSDGKYVYFFTKYDSDSTGNLNRIQTSKLKKGVNLEKFVEEIDTNVSAYFSEVDKGLIYRKNSDLYFYNNKDSEKIAKDVVNYRTDGKNVIFTQYNDDGTRNLYAISLNDTENKEKLLSSVDDFYTTKDFSSFYATRSNENGSDVYSVGIGKDAEKLFTCENLVGFFNESFVYTKKDKTVTLYEFVKDDLVSADSNVVSPDTDDYQTPVYSYKKISADYELEDGEEFVGTCTNPVRYIQDDYWWSYDESIEWAMSNDDDYAADYEAFYNKYASKENADGYFTLTDEALKDIKALAKKTGGAKNWKELCRVKYVYYYDTDWDSYYADRDKWYEAESRNSLREELKDPENGYDVSSICAWKSGEETVLKSDVVSYRYCSGALCFNTLDAIDVQLDIRNIGWAGEVKSYFYLDMSKQNSILLFNDNSIVKISSSAADSLNEWVNEKGRDANLSVTKDKLILKDDSHIMVANIENGEVGKFNEEMEDVRFSLANDEGFYYFDELYYEGGNTFGNLCYYNFADGSKKVLSKNIYVREVVLYEDGSVLAAKDVSYDSNSLTGYKGDFYLFTKDGESTKVATDAYFINRVDKKNILYLNDSDLYKFNGKESKKLRSDVYYYWLETEYPIEYNLGTY